MSSAGSVAAECFVSAPSVLWERCLSPLHQALAQRTGRHSYTGICSWKNQRVGICRLLEMGSTGDIQVFPPLCFNVFVYFSFYLEECKATVGSGQKLSTQGCVNIKSTA